MQLVIPIWSVMKIEHIISAVWPDMIVEQLWNRRSGGHIANRRRGLPAERALAETNLAFPGNPRCAEAIHKLCGQRAVVSEGGVIMLPLPWGRAFSIPRWACWKVTRKLQRDLLEFRPPR